MEWAVPFHYRKSSTQGALETVLILRIKKAAMRERLLLEMVQSFWQIAFKQA